MGARIRCENHPLLEQDAHAVGHTVVFFDVASYLAEVRERTAMVPDASPYSKGERQSRTNELGRAGCASAAIDRRNGRSLLRARTMRDATCEHAFACDGASAARTKVALHD